MTEQMVVAQVEQEISRRLSCAFLHIEEGDRQLLRRFGLTTTQYWALMHLGDTEGRSLTELAKLLLCDKSNVTNVVDKLEKAGLAERIQGKAGDRRYTRVVLTETGHHIRRKAKMAREYVIATRLQSLSMDALQDLHQTLQHLETLLAEQFANNEVSTLIDQALHLPEA